MSTGFTPNPGVGATRMTPISCDDADGLRRMLQPVSSLTNYIPGVGVLNPALPPWTETTWSDDEGAEVLLDRLDGSGCRHWLLEETR